MRQIQRLFLYIHRLNELEPTAEDSTLFYNYNSPKYYTKIKLFTCNIT